VAVAVGVAEGVGVGVCVALGVGRGKGVGRGRGVGVALGVGEGVAVAADRLLPPIRPHAAAAKHAVAITRFIPIFKRLPPLFLRKLRSKVRENVEQVANAYRSKHMCALSRPASTQPLISNTTS